MYDLANRVHLVQSLPPASRTTAATGATVDSNGFDAVVHVFDIGAAPDGTATPSLQDSADGVTWAAAAAADVVGTAAVAATNTVTKLGYVGAQRFTRPLITFTAATTGALSGALALLGSPRTNPTT